MSRSHPIEAGPTPMPCAAKPSDGTAQYVHPEGACACFHGGPAPVRVLAPELAVLASRPGVFDTTAVGQPTGARRAGAGLVGRLRAWLRGMFR